MNQPDVPTKDLNFKTYPLNPKELLKQVDEYVEMNKKSDEYPFINNIGTAFISIKSKIGNLKTISYHEPQAINLIILQFILSPINEHRNILDYHFLHHHPQKDSHFLQRMDTYGFSYLKTLVKEKYYSQIYSDYQVWKKGMEYLNWLRFENLEIKLNEFKNFQFINPNEMICIAGCEDAVFSILSQFVVDEDHGYLSQFLYSQFNHKMMVKGTKVGFLNTLKLLHDEGIIFPKIEHTVVADFIEKIFYDEDGNNISKSTIHKNFNQHRSDKNPNKTYILTQIKNLRELG
jgi:hypothetical protein